MALAVEGCTGWRYVVEEIEAAGFEAHLAEPADTQAARGRKHRAKTDRTDARLLRDLLAAKELPASWIPPEGVLVWRERVRLYVSLFNQRTVWRQQRIHARRGHPEGAIRAAQTRAMLADAQLSPAARERITVGYRMIDLTDVEAQPLNKALHRFGAKQPACRALVEAQYGIGGLIAVGGVVRAGRLPTLCPLGPGRAPHRAGRDRGRFGSASRRWFLVPAGTETLRWAPYEAAKNSSHLRSPDHDSYAAVKPVTTARSPRSRSLGSPGSGWATREPAS